MLEEIVQYFGDSNNCKGCGKAITNQSLRKKHLVSNHSKYVEEIKKLVDQAFESRKIPGLLKNNTEAESKSSQINTAVNGLLKCSFSDCDKKWESKDNKLNMKLHLISHFNKEFSIHYKTFFKAGKCQKCDKSSSTYNNTHMQNKHLYMRHQILIDEVEAKLKLIYKPTHEQAEEELPEKDVVKEIEHNDDLQKQVEDNLKNHEVNEPKGDVEAKINEKTLIEENDDVISGDNSTQHENSERKEEGDKFNSQDDDDNDVDSLLADSDDEADDADFHKMVLDQNNSDSDDDDNDSISERNGHLNNEVGDDYNMLDQDNLELEQHNTEMDTEEEKGNEDIPANVQPPINANGVNNHDIDDNDNDQEVGRIDNNDTDQLVEGEDIQNQLLMDQDISDDEDDDDFSEDEDTDNRSREKEGENNFIRNMDTEKDQENDDDLLQQNLLDDQDISDDDDMSDDE